MYFLTKEFRNNDPNHSGNFNNKSILHIIQRSICTTHLLLKPPIRI